MSFATADLYDEHGEDLQSVTTQFISVGGVHRFTGPIRTVRCFESNVDVKKLVATPGEGAVLVVDGQGSMNRALLGDNVARTAMENGWAGLIINAPVRDRVELGTLDIQVALAFAQAARALIDEAKHLVIASAHPSPLSARRGFFGSRLFSRANAWLEGQGEKPIAW